MEPGQAHGAEAADEHVGMPWHFWLLAAALAIYLGWRFFEGIEWVWHQVAG